MGSASQICTLCAIEPIGRVGRIMMKLLQAVCGFLACVMCIFILGPIAMVIVTGRVVHNWIRGVPNNYSNFESVYPMFITFVLLITIIYILV